MSSRAFSSSRSGESGWAPRTSRAAALTAAVPNESSRTAKSAVVHENHPAAAPPSVDSTTQSWVMTQTGNDWSVVETNSLQVITLTSTGGAVAVNNTVTTGAAAVTSTTGADSAVSGGVTVSAATGVSGSGQLVTGAASVSNTATGGGA